MDRRLILNSQSGSPAWRFLDGFLVFLVLFWVAFGAVPGVNEAHYLVKAKHFWDSGFASRDLFAASQDAHWFFFLSLGWPLKFLTLDQFAWLGRCVSSLFLAASWSHLARTALGYRFAGALTIPFFCQALELGNLSGEWVFGGFESKSIAYAFVFLAIAMVLEKRWSRAWPLLGMASAFHVVIGAWVTLDLLLFCVASSLLAAIKKDSLKGERVETIRNSLGGLFLGGALSLLGLIPVLAMNLRVDPAVCAEAAEIYVFHRLPHHLSPATFAVPKWQAFEALFAVCLLTIWFGRNKQSSISWKRVLWPIAWIATLLAAVGWGIDLMLRDTHTALAASLLRYYWFRWNDVVWPLTFALVLGSMARIDRFGSRQRSDDELHSEIASKLVWHRLRQKIACGLSRLILALGALGVFISGISQIAGWTPSFESLALTMRGESLQQQAKTMHDWEAVCRWIERETPADSLWMTPRYQQTFKWRTGRSEVANWKDIPQDATSIVEWYRRIRTIYRYAGEGGLLPPDPKIVAEVRDELGVEYLLVDLRLTSRRLPFDYLYPTGSDENTTFAIYRIDREAGP